MYGLASVNKTCDTTIQGVNATDLYVRQLLLQVDHTLTDGTTAATGYVRVAYSTSAPGSITPATCLFSLSGGGSLLLPSDLSVQEDREYVNLKNLWVKSTQANMVIRFVYNTRLTAI